MKPILRLITALALTLALSTIIWAARPPAQTVTSIAGMPLDAVPAAPPPVRSMLIAPVVPSAPPSSSALPGAANNSDSLQLLSLFRAHPELLNVSQTPELRADYIHLVPGLSGLRDRVYVRLVQTFQTIDVADADVLFSYDPAIIPMQIESLRSSLYPAIAVAFPQAPADQTARQQLALRVGSAKARNLSPKIRWFGDHWEALQEYSLMDEGLHAGVNAAGKVYVWDDRRYAGYAGQVSGRAVAFNPLLTGTLLNTLLLPDLKISDGLGVDAYTDSLGKYAFTTPSAANVSVGLTGRWGVVQDQSNTPLLVTIANGAVIPVNLLFNPSGNAETDVAQ